MVPMDIGPESVQKLMLTPRMLLSMHVLRLNIIDLRTFIRAELEENALLEEEETREILFREDNASLGKDLSILIDGDIQQYDLPPVVDEKVYSITEEKRRYLESLITEKESLYEHLHWQLEVLAENDKEKRIGEFIIGNIDDNGFLNMELDQMREEIGVDVESFNRALTLVRSFDPVGVGARNTKESLLLQLFLSGRGDSELYRIVNHHLEDLVKSNYEKVAGSLGISPDEVKSAVKKISYLNPKPGAVFSDEEAVTIEPDVFLVRNNGSFTVEINEGDLPRLTINRYYSSILKDKKAPRETKEYIKKKLLSARWVIDAIRQRKNTITRICEYLSGVQKDFLKNGDAALKPLTLRQAADELSVSQATVSRVVSNKYAHVSGEVFALKEFFSGGVKSDDGAIVSDRSIKQKILDLIEEEDSRSPLSDNEITLILRKEGISIARRTVAKYRENLNILPSGLRGRKR